MDNENMKFEEAFSKLREQSAKITAEGVSLDEALASYKEGKKYYQICKGILDEATQMIEMFDRESGELHEMEQI